MGDRNAKSIRFSAEVDEKLEKFSRKLGRSKLLVFCQMVDYFSRTGKDPLDINDEVLRRSQFKYHNTYMQFLKVQEKDLLIPIREETGRVYASQREIIGLLNKQVIEANRTLLDGQALLKSKLPAIEELIRSVREQLVQKRELKRHCSLIFEAYVEAREKLSVLDGKERRQSLLENAREQLKLL
ncbi:MAG: hypothetical protein EOO88_46190 [Pedobacter sp.]|nr:MAG: hypothetical protein EOO88_46190 [Pedobacter sp.]